MPRKFDPPERPTPRVDTVPATPSAMPPRPRPPLEAASSGALGPFLESSQPPEPISDSVIHAPGGKKLRRKDDTAALQIEQCLDVAQRQIDHARSVLRWLRIGPAKPRR